ncbi:MAG TPA: glycosyltransferase family 4 protein [Myxococcota bacterium]
MRLCVALPGLHRVDRGAEVALERVADLMARRGDCEVVVFGSGPVRADRAYRYVQVPCVPRERFEGWPRLPLFRDECAYEELSFAWNLRRVFRPRDFDLTLTCGYPFLNWTLRRGRREGRPKHVFVTQNGDWPAFSRRREYRFFSCDGLICVNPLHQERNRARWRCRLISNGVDLERFKPSAGRRERFGIPTGLPVVLMVSALIDSKNVASGIRAVSRLPDYFLILAGDGPLREQTDRLAAELLPNRYRRLQCPRDEMAELYRCADAFLHLSRDESCAISNLEALATGLPIVAQDSPVARWLLEDQAQFVDAGDEASVAEALRAAAHASGEEQRVQRRELAQRRYGWSAIAAQYSEFLSQVHTGAAHAPQSPLARPQVAAPGERFE